MFASFNLDWIFSFFFSNAPIIFIYILNIFFWWRNKNIQYKTYFRSAQQTITCSNSRIPVLFLHDLYGLISTKESVKIHSYFKNWEYSILSISNILNSLKWSFRTSLRYWHTIIWKYVLQRKRNITFSHKFHDFESSAVSCHFDTFQQIFILNITA